MVALPFICSFGQGWYWFMRGNKTKLNTYNLFSVTIYFHKSSFFILLQGAPLLRPTIRWLNRHIHYIMWSEHIIEVIQITNHFHYTVHYILHTTPTHHIMYFYFHAGRPIAEKPEVMPARQLETREYDEQGLGRDNTQHTYTTYNIDRQFPRHTSHHHRPSFSPCMCCHASISEQCLSTMISYYVTKYGNLASTFVGFHLVWWRH